MAIPPEISNIIARLNQELTTIEQDATRGMSLLNSALDLFPNNNILVQFFAFLNNILFMADSYKRQIQTIVDRISPDDVPTEVVQDAGEELGNLLGRVLEAKIGMERILDRLENLQ
jgi:hypothetical protein